MKISEQIPRNALLWLIIGQLMLLLPLLTWLPPWIFVVSVVVAVWRLQVFRGHWSYPGRWPRAVMGVLAAVAVFASFRSFLGLEPMVALLLVAASLKLLEAKSIRDGYVLTILGFFVCLTIFLFDQGIPYALYVLICIAVLLSVLIALNQRPTAPMSPRIVGVSAGLLAQALPLMLLPFLVFPRIAPLWNVPMKRHGAETGMSDRLRPGDVARLSQSDAVAFRVQFEGDTPPISSLYWRGMTMGSLEDGTWQQHSARSMPRWGRMITPPEKLGEVLRYRVIQSATQQEWLYGIRYAESGSSRVIPISDFRFEATIPLEFEFGYQVESWPDTPLEPRLPPWRRRLETGYPDNLDPRSQELVDAWRAEDPDPEAIVMRALQYFRERPFFYTLEPPVIDDPDFVDTFLFESRRGFCEHYAYSFTALMRQAGLPARIVAGYQGGEINPVNGTVVVRQLDAHAWSEVWLAGRGWVRVDPTAAVAPDRIELGFAGLMREDEAFLSDSPISALRFSNIGLVNWLRMRYDAVAWRWQTLVVGFGDDAQIEILERLLGEITPSRMMLFFLAGSLLILGPGAWFLFRPTPGERPPLAEREFMKLCRQLARQGIERDVGEAPRAFVDRAKAAMSAERALALEARFESIEQALYRPT